jgi:hypothetical protein
MSWYQILFPEDTMPLDVQNALMHKLLAIYIGAGDPEGFATFTEVRADARYLMYFTPVAAEYCMELIASYGGVPCEQPKARRISMIWSILPYVGDLKCREWVQHD